MEYYQDLSLQLVGIWDNRWIHKVVCLWLSKRWIKKLGGLSRFLFLLVLLWCIHWELLYLNGLNHELDPFFHELDPFLPQKSVS